jgi:hypothetical protein
LLSQNRYHEAILKFNEVLNVYPDNQKAQEGIKEAMRVIQPNHENGE